MIDKQTQMRVPAARYAYHRSTIAKLAVGNHQKNLPAAREEFKGDFGRFVLLAPGVTQQARRLAARHAPNYIALLCLIGSSGITQIRPCRVS